ncbi:Holliday junction resolvase RuvX [Patescibacteria group bacterium]|nr:Holliday junction resolvase RuvX [Patescibacteria group bacterium]
MKYLGIDYGEKNVGIAISDDGGNLAFAKTVLDNDKNLLKNILKIIEDDRIEVIVVGESINLNGEENPIQKKILGFKKNLKENVKIPIHFQPEFLTSMEARRLQEGVKKIDASAAALILKSFLDKS